jgi:hypothetical protein
VHCPLLMLLMLYASCCVLHGSAWLVAAASCPSGF